VNRPASMALWLAVAACAVAVVSMCSGCAAVERAQKDPASAIKAAKDGADTACEMAPLIPPGKAKDEADRFCDALRSAEAK